MPRFLAVMLALCAMGSNVVLANAITFELSNSPNIRVTHTDYVNDSRTTEFLDLPATAFTTTVTFQQPSYVSYHESSSSDGYANYSYINSYFGDAIHGFGQTALTEMLLSRIGVSELSTVMTASLQVASGFTDFLDPSLSDYGQLTVYMSLSMGGIVEQIETETGYRQIHAAHHLQGGFNLGTFQSIDQMRSFNYEQLMDLLSTISTPFAWIYEGTSVSELVCDTSNFGMSCASTYSTSHDVFSYGIATVDTVSVTEPSPFFLIGFGALVSILRRTRR